MDIIYRKEWKAKPNKGRLVRMKNLRKIVVHHAAGYDDSKGEFSYERMLEVQKFHQTKRRWNDIGYHFLIDSTGCVFQGRDFYDKITDITLLPDFVHGAHVKNNNSDKVGICLLGCYHPPAGSNCEQNPTDESLDSLVELCVFICKNYSLTSEDIVMHRDLRKSACPGDNIAELVEQLKSTVKSRFSLG